MATSERRWPRWWAVDDGMALVVLVPAWSALRRIGGVRTRLVRILLATVVSAVTAVVAYLLG